MPTITFAQAATIFIEIGFLIQKSAYCNRKNKLSYLGDNVIKYVKTQSETYVKYVLYMYIYKYMYIYTYTDIYTYICIYICIIYI